MLVDIKSTKSIEEEFIVRPPTLADLEEAHALFEVCSYQMIGKSEASLNDVRTEWLLPEFDLEKATRLVLTPYGQTVGYIEVWDIDATPASIWVWGRVHPEYEGLGIGTYLMDWAEKRSRQAIRRVPDGIRVIMRSGAYSNYEPAHRLLNEQGMELVRNFYTMAIELDQAPPLPKWPEGITVRTMQDCSELREVVEAVEEAFRDHWGFVEQPFEEQFEHWQHFTKNDEDHDPTLWFLAMDGDEIAGVSLCSPRRSEDPDMGWVNTLGVRRPWRQMGLGLALLHHSFAEFHRRGQKRVGLGVDANSLTGATRLYERAGMRPIRQFDSYEKELRPGRDISRQELND